MAEDSKQRDSKQPSLQAGLRFEKAQKLAREGEKARAEYDAAGRAADANRARLKALRLAKEAAELEAAAPVAPAASKKNAAPTRIAAARKTAPKAKKTEG